MQQPNPYDKYLLNSISISSKEELTLMLYDGALKFCNQGITALEARDLEKAHEVIMKAQKIIREFQLTLDRRYEISKSFDIMYDYIYGKLIDANIKKDVEHLKEARALIKEFRDTWKEAMLIAKKEANAQANAQMTTPVK